MARRRVIFFAFGILVWVSWRMVCRARLNFRSRNSTKDAEQVPIVLRLSRAEFKLLCEAADAKGVSYSEYVKMCAITRAAGFSG